MAKQKIYDCFAFFNELDILEIRLTELYDVVDYFVIVEATTKFSGEKKPLYFKENGNRFKKWGEKIIHIIVEPPKLNFIDKFNIFWEKKKIFTANKIGRNFVVGKWKLDYWQKNQTALGLKNAKEGDIIFLSDADEIIPKKIVKQAINMLSKHPSSIIKVNNQCFYYYLNGKCSDDSIGNAACKYKLLKEKLNNQPQRIRENYGFLNLLMVKLLKRESIKKHIIKGGWHFSYLGGADVISDKIGAIAHSEFDNKTNKDKKRIEECLSKGKDLFERGMSIKYIKIPEKFPIAIKKNPEKYKHLIKNDI